MDLEVRMHPTLGVPVRSDGAVYCRHTRHHTLEWNYGSKNGRGYMFAFINGKRYSVHRMVADTFIQKPEGMNIVDHIDRNTANNSVENLRWTDLHGNMVNTAVWEMVETRDGVHSSDNLQDWCKAYRTRKHAVTFSNGKMRWLDPEIASELLKIPRKERVLSEARL